MAQYVDFVGLNRFVYDMCGWDIENQKPTAAEADLAGVNNYTILSDQYGWEIKVHTLGNNHANRSISDSVFAVEQNTFGSSLGANGSILYPMPKDDYADLGAVYANHQFNFGTKPSVLKAGSTDTAVHPTDYPHHTSSYFAALSLSRNGPYGHPSWKQIRSGDNALIRKQRQNSVITVLGPPKLITVETATQKREILSRYGDINVFREAPISSRYHPVSFNVGNQVISRGKKFMRN